MGRAKQRAPDREPAPEPARGAVPSVLVGRVLWVGALALTLMVLFVHGAARQRGIDAATAQRVGAGLSPRVDSTSPSGYRWGTHRLVLPETDSYLWLLQAEEELATGTRRIRASPFDNAPAGREVHWAGFERWWALGLTALHQLAHPELRAVQSLERVAPWANTVLLALFLVALTPLVAARLGAIAAAVVALGTVAVFPFLEQTRAGYFDHHAPATLAGLAAVLWLGAGGAGWVREGGPRARRWFVASGVAAGFGLWVSAATMAPVLVGVGLGALLGVGVAARGGAAPAGSRLDASLFRAWGMAGAVTSVALYLLEYFPGHLGWRLEVNHPLYALALAGGGDLIARLAPAGDRRPASRAWVALDLALVLQLPLVILATRAATFRVADPVLWLFHNRFIYEFLALPEAVATLTPAQVVGRVSLVALAGLPIAAILWPTALGGAWRLVWRSALVGLASVVGAYAFAFFSGITRGPLGGVVGAAVAVALGFGLPLRLRAPPLAADHQAALAIVSLPAAVMLALSLGQVRWAGVAGALWLGALAVLAAVVVERGDSLLPRGSRRTVFAAFAALVFIVSPAFALREPFSPPNAMVIERDAALWLRRRVGPDPVVLLAAPATTADMIWFGGFRGLGTLYWENLDGLRAAAEICGAADPGAARAALARRGVTHLVAVGWDGGLEQLAQAIEEAGDGTPWPRPAGVRPMCRHQPGDDLPPWLAPLPYAPPRVAGYEHPVVRLFEIVDEPPPEIALARQARYYQAVEDRRMREVLDRSLAVGPSVAGLAMMAQLQSAAGEPAALVGTVERLRAELERGGPVDPENRVEAALALALARDAQGAASQLASALEGVGEGDLRRLSPERLAVVVELSRQLGLDRRYPEAVRRAATLLQDL